MTILFKYINIKVIQLNYYLIYINIYIEFNTFIEEKYKRIFPILYNQILKKDIEEELINSIETKTFFILFPMK